MLRGDWRSKLTLGLAVAFYALWLALAAFSYLTHVVPEHEVAQQAANNARGEADSEAQRDAADLRAQQGMAWAAWTQVGLSALGLVGLLFTVIYARNAWRAAREATADAREQFELERRAWVRVDGEVSHIFGERGEVGRILFVVTTENIGLSHALDVSVTTPEPTFVWDDADILELAEQISDARTDAIPPGATLFPRETEQHFQNLQVELPPKEWEDTPYMRHVAGWVTYRLTPGGESRFTPFCFNVLYWWSDKEGEWRWSESTRVAVPIAPD